MVLRPEDNRHFFRTKLQTPLRYQVRGNPDFSNTVANNISVGGLGFVNDKFIAPDTLLSFEIRILSRVVNPIGRISWSTPVPHSDRYRLGVEFVEVNLTDKQYLQDFVEMQKSNA